MLFRICTFRIGFGEEVENASGSPSSVQGFRLIGLLRNMVMVPMSIFRNSVSDYYTDTSITTPKPI